MSELGKDICSAIDVIAKKRVSELQFDRTIQGTIISRSNVVTGEYKIQYQDSVITAYSSSPNLIYDIDTMVYVLVPGNDFSVRKIIQGPASSDTLTNNLLAAYTYDYTPALDNYPANTWSYEDRALHVGELFIDVSTGFVYTFSRVWNENTQLWEYSWNQLSASDVGALQDQINLLEDNLFWGTGISINGAALQVGTVDAGAISVGLRNVSLTSKFVENASGMNGTTALFAQGHLYMSSGVVYIPYADAEIGFNVSAADLVPNPSAGQTYYIVAEVHVNTQTGVPIAPVTIYATSTGWPADYTDGTVQFKKIGVWVLDANKNGALAVSVGQTIINGNQILTGTVTADSIRVGSDTYTGSAFVNQFTSLTGFLSNEAAILAADSAGNVASGTFANFATGIFYVYDGATDITGASSGITYSASSMTNCAGSINASGRYNASTLTQDSGSIQFNAYYAARGITIRRTFNLAKAKAPSTVPILTLSCSSQHFTYDGTNTLTSASSITITAERQNISSSGVVWTFNRNGSGTFLPLNTASGVTIASGAIETLTIPHNATAVWSTADSLTIKGTLGGVYDTTSIYKSSDGLLGADAYTILSSNDSGIIRANSSGVPYPTSFTITMTGYQGGTQHAISLGTASGTVANQITASPSSSGMSPYYTVTVATGLTASAGTLTLPVTIDNLTINKSFNWIRVNEGTMGYSAASLDILAENGNIFINGSGSSYSPPFLKFTPLVQNVGGIVQWTTNPTIPLYTAATVGQGTQVQATGLSYASSVYMRVGDVIPLVPSSGILSISLNAAISGSATLQDTIGLAVLKEGDSAITVLLSNANYIVPAKADGTVSSTDLANSATNIMVYEGSTPLHYSADPGSNGRFTIGQEIITPSNGLTAASPLFFPTGAVLDYASGKPYTAMASGILSATVDFPITVITLDGRNLGVYATPRQTLTKARTGQDAQYIEISGANTFIFVDGASVPSATSILLSAQLYGGLTGYNWKYWNGSQFTTLGPASGASGSTYTLAYNESAWGTGRFLRVACFAGSGIATSVPATGMFDEMTIAKVADGIPGYTIYLTNESQTVPAAYDGSNPNLAGAATEVIVLKGSTIIDPSLLTYWASGYPATGVTGSFGAGVDKDLYTVSSMLNDTVYVDLYASGTFSGSGLTFVKRFSLMKSKSALAGATAKSVDLSTTTQAFVYNATGGVPSPTSSTFTATSYNCSGVPYYQFFINGVASGVSASGAGSGFTYYPQALYTNMPQTVSVELRDGSSTNQVVGRDSVTAFGIKPGQASISGYLTNENYSVVTDASGNNYSLTNASGIFKVYNGTSNVTVGSGTVYHLDDMANATAYDRGTTWTITTASGLTLIINEASGIYNASAATASSWTSDVEVFNLVATNSGVEIIKTFSISKTKSGASGAAGTPGTPGSAGANARSVDIAISNQSFSYNASGGVPSPASGYVTATLRGATGVPYYQFFINEVASGSVSTASGFNYWAPALYTGMPQTIKVEAREGAAGNSVVATDTLGVIGLKPGADGNDSVVGYLTNEAIVISANATGGQYSLVEASGNFKVYKGINDITTGSGTTYKINGAGVSDNGATQTRTASGLTIILNETTGLYTASGTNWTSENESFSFTATPSGAASGTPVTKILTISQSRDGASGLPGASGTPGLSAKSVDLVADDQAFIYDDAGLNPSPSTGIVIAASGQNCSGTPWYEFFINASSVQHKTQNTYTYLPQASWDNMPQLITVKMRDNASTNAVVAVDLMSMIGIKPGASGQNSVSAFLTNATQTVTANATGGNYSLTSASGIYKVFDGVTDVTTSGANFNQSTILGWASAGNNWSLTKGNLTLTIDKTTGIYTLSGTGWNTTSENWDIRVTYNGLTITQNYQITKIKDAINAITGYLTNESATIPCNTAGVVISTTPANGNFIVYDGTTNVTSQVQAANGFSKVSETGCTATIGANTGAYSISLMPSDTASVTFRATYNGVSIDQILSLTKSKSADFLEINSEQAFTYLSGATLPNPTAITLNVMASTGVMAGGGYYLWQYYNGTNFVNFSPIASGNSATGSYSIAHNTANVWTANPKAARIRCIASGTTLNVYDETTLNKIYDGAASKMISIAGPQMFKYNGSGGLTSATSVTLELSPMNLSASSQYYASGYDWSFAVDASGNYTSFYYSPTYAWPSGTYFASGNPASSGNPVKFTIAHNATGFPNWYPNGKSLTIRVASKEEPTAIDYITLYRLIDGSSIQGASGRSALMYVGSGRTLGSAGWLYAASGVVLTPVPGTLPLSSNPKINDLWVCTNYPFASGLFGGRKSFRCTSEASGATGVWEPMEENSPIAGTSFINGGIIETNTIVARHIAASSISTNQVNSEFGQSLDIHSNTNITTLVDAIYATGGQLQLKIDQNASALTQTFDVRYAGSAALDDYKKYIKFVNGTIYIGDSASGSVGLLMQNSEIGFYNNNDLQTFLSTGQASSIIVKPLAKFASGELIIKQANFDDSIVKFGNASGRFAFMPRANGNLSFGKFV